VAWTSVFFLSKKDKKGIKKIVSCISSPQFLVIKALDPDPDPDLLEKLDPDPYPDSINLDPSLQVYPIG
jgi:hypothetical protein